MKKSTIYAVDFDGTLCRNAWPDIGAPRSGIIEFVKEEQKDGAKLILWTNRCGNDLEKAVKWCEEQGLIFDAINDNLPETIEHFGENCRKVFADIYLDDRSMSLDTVERYMTW